ncbi:MAG: hypothetical protein R3D05_16705 [Dongiaceae bacterium]
MKLTPRGTLLAATVAALAFAACPAFAYVGPGAGLTLLGALWGLVLAVVMSIGFVVLWPFRRLLRRNKHANATRDGRDAGDPDEETEHSMLANSSDDREERR